MSLNPGLSASIARDAATRIRAKIAELEATKPNDPSTLDGWEKVTDILKTMSEDFDKVAVELEAFQIEATQPEGTNRLRNAATTAIKIYDSAHSWVDTNASAVGTVLAKMGLAGTIALALGYLVGVPPLASFTVAMAGLHGADMWEAIKLFAPGKK